MTQTQEAPPQEQGYTPPVPQQEHQWLHQLVGEWTAESAFQDPNQNDGSWAGTERIKSMGGLWVVSEGTTVCGGEPVGQSMMTIGYDPAKERFVGTWVGTMATYLWVYEGTLDADERVLTLACDGPSFTDPTKLAPYEDIITIHDKDHWTLTARTKGEDGAWVTFMTTHYRRTA